MRNHLIEKRAFDGEVFGDGFDDPVAVFDPFEVVVEVTGGHEAAGFGNKKRAGPAFERGIDAIAGGLVRHVEKK